TFQTADAEAVLELSKGPHRYQAVFAGGQVKLTRLGPQGKEMATAATGITGPGKHALRFANVDCRLRVWVDGKRINFGPAADYAPDALPETHDPTDRAEEGWTAANDVAAPASVGAKGGVAFRKLALWRDTYFTYSEPMFTGIAKYADTFYVQPGHYLCLGDNSAQSSDSRKWGTVPERLLLGKAVAVFFPLNRIGLIE
ncbi:MAG: S26 family signal peptidase, partial [Fimbriiglobus sp.]